MLLSRDRIASLSTTPDLGLTEGAIRAVIGSGRFEQIYPGVYSIGGSPNSWERRVFATCLFGGREAWASHRTAAALLELAGFEKGPVEISTTRNLRKPPPGVIFHRILQPPACDVFVVRGIPTTDPGRTLIDVASFADDETLEIALDDALRRLISVPRLRWRIQTVGINGKQGTRRLARLLAERAGSPHVESALETIFARFVRRAELPVPEKQFEVRDGEFSARVDFAYPERRIAIEVDGYAPHSGRMKFEDDRERRNLLESLGWRVINVTDKQIRTGSHSLIALLRKMLS